MKTNLDNIERRLRGIEGALRLRPAEAVDPWGVVGSPIGERVPRDALRLRWHLDEPAAVEVVP